MDQKFGGPVAPGPHDGCAYAVKLNYITHTAMQVTLGFETRRQDRLKIWVKNRFTIEKRFLVSSTISKVVKYDTTRFSLG
jgi:hypothetical protein